MLSFTWTNMSPLNDSNLTLEVLLEGSSIHLAVVNDSSSCSPWMLNCTGRVMPMLSDQFNLLKQSDSSLASGIIISPSSCSPSGAELHLKTDPSPIITAITAKPSAPD